MPKVLLLLFLFVSACTSNTAIKPLQLMLIPSQETQVLEEVGDKLRLQLEKDIGQPVEMKVPVNYTAVIEAFGSKRVDVAFMNSFGYLLAREKYKAEARLIAVSKGKKEYYGQVIARKDKVKTLKDLNGKNFAFVSPISGSGYLTTLKLLKENGLKMGEHSFMGRHDSVVAAVYQGRADAGATFYATDVDGQPNDARRLVKTQYPDIYEKVIRIALTGPLPNEPVVFRSDMSEELKQKVIQSFQKFIRTEEGKKIFHQLYHFDDLALATDKDYDPLIHDLKIMGQDPQKLLQ